MVITVWLKMHTAEVEKVIGGKEFMQNKIYPYNENDPVHLY